MRRVAHHIELSDEEIQAVVEILRYAQDYCPLESISDEVKLDNDTVEDLIDKLETVLEAY